MEAQPSKRSVVLLPMRARRASASDGVDEEDAASPVSASVPAGRRMRTYAPSAARGSCEGESVSPAKEAEEARAASLRRSVRSGRGWATVTLRGCIARMRDLCLCLCLCLCVVVEERRQAREESEHAACALPRHRQANARPRAASWRAHASRTGHLSGGRGETGGHRLRAAAAKSSPSSVHSASTRAASRC